MATYINSNCDIPFRLNEDCMFKNIGSCVDKVSSYICNSHARIFGLTYKRVSFVNGENKSWSKIVTYICGYNDFRLPLFHNLDTNITAMSEVTDFILSVKNSLNISNEHVSKYVDRILSQIGVTTINMDRCFQRGWVSSPSSEIILYDPDEENQISYPGMDLPMLHKKLLCYMEPSILINNVSQYNVFRPEFVALTRMDDSFQFVVINKKELLKYDGEDSVATILTLFALMEKNSSSDDDLKTIRQTRHLEC